MDRFSAAAKVALMQCWQQVQQSGCGGEAMMVDTSEADEDAVTSA